MFAKYYLAELLHLTLEELEEKMTVDEFYGWYAYLKHKHKKKEE